MANIIDVPGQFTPREYGVKLAKLSDIDNNVYGPYESVAAAHTALSAISLNVVGVTVGIIGANNIIVEYWYQGGTSQNNLVEKQQDIDATPTYGSEKAVSSNGVFSELADLGRDVNLLSSVSGTEVVDSGSRLTPAAYKAGDIFYVEEGNEGQNFSQFVYGIKYYVAKADGNAGSDLDSYLFDNTYSSTEALRLSAKYGGSEQIQSDWNQTNTEAKDYIKNKPTIPDTNNFATKQEVSSGLAYKVDKETGKGLSTNDYSTIEKNKLANLPTNTQLESAINAKADKSTTLAGYGITDAYNKSETYSKTEINDHIDTPNQGYITAVADSNTTTANLKTLIDTAAGSDKEKADFIYRVGSWDGSQYDETAYSEYAWNGTDYIFLSKKSQVDEVFDISAYHADTKYANLAAALGTDGANIPQNLRKGGMSVKFVLSSDNKYVQYMYLGTAITGTPNPFLNINNWVKVANSNDLGNVSLAVEVTGYIIDDGDVEIGEVIPARRSSSNWLGYTMMQASAGDIVRAFGTNSNGVLLWAWLDSESRLLARGEKYSTENGEPHVAPNNTAYLLAHFKDSSTIIQYSSNNSIDSDIVALSGEIKEVAEELNLTKEEISKEISGTAPATGAYYPFNFKAGEKYQVKIGDNFRGTVTLLTSSTTGKTTRVDYLAQDIGKGETSKIVELTGDAAYLRVGTSTAGVAIPFEVYKVTTYDRRLTIVEEKAESIENAIDGLDVAKTNATINKVNVDVISKISGTKPQGSGVYYPYTFIQGHKYKLYNDSDANSFQAFLYTGKTTEERVQTLPTLGHGDSLEFVAEANASFMYIGYTNSVQKYILYDMGALDFRTKEIENELQVVFNGSKVSGDGAFFDVYLVSDRKYRIKNTSTNGAVFSAFAYSIKTGSPLQTLCDALPANSSVDFVAENTTQFLRIGWTSNVVEFKIEDLTTITSRLYKLEDVAENDRKIYPFTPDFDISRVPQLTGERKYIDTKDINVLYNLYDGLMAQYPNYISKIDMSDADQYLPVQRPSALDGLPIYMYHFEPTRYKNLGRTAPSVDDGRRFVVYINCGTHPDEKFNLFTVFYMMKMICENWKNDVNAEMLRTLIDIYVVPCNSPYGFAHAGEDTGVAGVAYGRVNENKVNLNRNYPVDGWTEGGQGTNNYTGPSAGSEYETQLTMYYVKLLKPKVFLDAHTPWMADPWRDKGTVISNGDFPKDIGAAVCATTNAIFCKENADYPDLEDWCLYTMQYGGINGSCAQWVWQNGGCTASTLEGAENNQWHNKEWAPEDWDHTELSERGEWSDALKEYRSNRLMRENIQYYFNWLLRSIHAMCHQYYNIKDGERI